LIGYIPIAVPVEGGTRHVQLILLDKYVGNEVNISIISSCQTIIKAAFL
jgi:hypothetical protein